MAKMKEEPSVVRCWSLEDLRTLEEEVQKFISRNSIDDFYIEEDSVAINIYSDGTIKINAEVTATIEDYIDF